MMLYIYVIIQCVYICFVTDAFGLSHPESYYYLRQSSCFADKTINDKGTFQDVLVCSGHGWLFTLHSLN